LFMPDTHTIRFVVRSPCKPLIVSAFGTKRTSHPCLPMSAFGGKADITIPERHVCF
jgi:hypothetical protein